MIENASKEMIYLAAFDMIKRMLEQGIITREAFERLNDRIAREQFCKPMRL